MPDKLYHLWHFYIFHWKNKLAGSCQCNPLAPCRYTSGISFKIRGDFVVELLHSEGYRNLTTNLEVEVTEI